MINNEYIQEILDGDNERLEELRNPPQTKLCHHFHRVHLSEEEGIKNNCPKEEFRYLTVFYEFPSRIETSYWYESKNHCWRKDQIQSVFAQNVRENFRLRIWTKWLVSLTV